MATFDTKSRSYSNVELKGHIDSNENHEIGDQFGITTPYGAGALVRVIHRKAQFGNPMGKWKYLIEYVREGRLPDKAK